MAACLSLSSTPLVAKFVESKSGDSSTKGNASVNDKAKHVFKPM